MENYTKIAMLPYQHAISNKISRILSKHNIKIIHVPMRKTASTLRPLKDNLGLKNSRRVLYTVRVREGLCRTDMKKFRDQMQGAHEALLPGSTRKFSCSGTCYTHRAQHEIQPYSENGQSKWLYGQRG